MQYVTDIIGEDYMGNYYSQDHDLVKSWLDIPEFSSDGYGGGNCIFISAPTGSGKTHFILNIWLEYIASLNKKMLYLVNRSILKMQMEKEIMDISPSISSCVDVKLYQNIEHGLKMCEYRTDENKQREQKKEDEGLEHMKQKYSKYDCVVCDECHYFLTDSNYNTDTGLSFRWIQDCFADKIRIFMSATIRDIKLYIKGYDESRICNGKVQKYWFPDFKSVEKVDVIRERANEILRSKGSRFFEYREFEIPRNYDYIDAKIIYNTDTIAEIINDEDKTEKWLIFVDKIDTGKDVGKKIKDKNNVVFVSSRNKQEDGVSDTVDEITYYKRMKSKRIIIATSVMDNGINIKDIKLRNIVLMADTETEFIQMLGRKRDDGKKLKLYIYRYDKEHFERRLSRIDQILEIATSYLKYLNSCKRAYVEQYKEELVIQNRHIKLMREIFDNKISMMYARNLFNVYGGVFYLNLLSYQNLINLKAYYQNVIASFDAEEDDAKREDCFVKMQLGWLGIEEKKAEDIIKKSKVTKFDKCYNKVIDAFEGMRNIPMNEKEAKNFQINIRDEIIVLIDSIKDDMKDDEKFKTARAQGGKSKCALSRPTVEFLNKHCGIPYQMTVKSTADGKRYTIRKEDWGPDA